MSDATLIEGPNGVSCTGCGAVVVPAPAPRGVYLAGGSSERAFCRSLIERLRAEGVEVVHDWTADPGWAVADPTPDMLRRAAAGDLEAVRRCAVLWYVAPVAKSEGSHGELVGALALSKHVVVSGTGALSLGRIFPLLASALYPTHEEGFAAVLVALEARP